MYKSIRIMGKDYLAGCGCCGTAPFSSSTVNPNVCTYCVEQGEYKEGDELTPPFQWAYEAEKLKAQAFIEKLDKKIAGEESQKELFLGTSQGIIDEDFNETTYPDYF